LVRGISTIFTAEEDYLGRLKSIKSTLKSPDHFSGELGELESEIVTKVGACIPSSDERFELFSAIAQYAKN
jgi:hypothetical protein